MKNFLKKMRNILAHHASAGFSLVELLIVITLTVMIIASASSVLLTALLSGGRVNTVDTIKQNGDYAIGLMTTLLRNSSKLLPNDAGETCTSGMTQLRFQSFDEGITTFERDIISTTDARIASNSAVYLTSNAVYLTDSLVFDCAQDSDGVTTNISISFGLTTGDVNTSRITEYGQQTFTSNVTIRSF